jgi:hypothetical protein
MSRIGLGICVPVLLVLSARPQAADPKPKGEGAAIDKVVAASLEAARKMDWKGYAELLHPDSLQDYKRMWVPVFQAAAKKGPAERAELLSLFENATDLKAVIALKPKEFFVSSMKGMAAAFGPLVPAPKKGPVHVDVKVLGTVREGRDLAHAVVRVRTKSEKTELTKVELITLKRSGPEWRLLLPDAVRGLAEHFRRSGTPTTGPATDSPDPDR